VTFVTNATGSVTRGDHRYGGHLHQGLRRHYFLGSHADDQRRQSGHPRHGRLYRDLRHEERRRRQNARAGGSVNDGNSGNNYAVTVVTDTTGSISARAITVRAVTNTKVYDGLTSAAATPTISTGSLATGDAAAFSETYGDPNIGTGKTLTPAGSVNDGNSGANYTVSFVNDTTGAIITGSPRTTTLTSSPNPSSTVIRSPSRPPSPPPAAPPRPARQRRFLRYHDQPRPRQRHFGSSNNGNRTSTWTFTTGVKTFNVTLGDTITASYTAGTGFGDSFGTTVQTVTARFITVTAVTSTRVTTARPRQRLRRRSAAIAWSPATRRPSSKPYDTKNVGTAKTLSAPAPSATATVATTTR